MKQFEKSHRLSQVNYEIRGEIYEQAQHLEQQGHKILKLNIGNPAPYGFDTPDEIVQDVIANIRNGQGYSESQGIFSARKAVMQYCQQKGMKGVEIEDIYIGAGVSEMILITMQALLNEGDEILVPAPDYPLWTSAIRLYGGKAVHYYCDEHNGWLPDLADITQKISPKTKGIVLINPNNPTGAVYPAEFLQTFGQLAAQHELIVFSDEIYDSITYEGEVHHATAKYITDTLVITYNGLSKNYRAAGFRAGWLILSGRKVQAKSLVEGLQVLTSMRLCSNVPVQYVIQTALGGYQSIKDLVAPQGRLRKQRDYALKRLQNMEGITCNPVQGAFYLFPKIDLQLFDFEDDIHFVMQLLQEKKVLFVQGQGFNWFKKDRFRIVFLPNMDMLEEVFDKLEQFLAVHRKAK